MVWADAVLFGTPTRYGNVSAQRRAAAFFALLTGPEGQPWCEAAQQLSEKSSVPIATARIGAGAEYADVEGRWEAVRQITDAGAILVRPDHHVLWRSTGGSENPLSDLEAALSLAVAPPAG